MVTVIIDDITTAVSAESTNRIITDPDLLDLSSPIQRYLRFSGIIGHSWIDTVHLKYASRFRMSKDKPYLSLMAWLTMIISSVLPDITLNTMIGFVPEWLVWVKVFCLVVLLMLAFQVKLLHSLMAFIAIMLALNLGTILISNISLSISNIQMFLGNSAFVRELQPNQTGKIILTSLVMLTLYLLGYRHKQMFLGWGKLNTPINPVRFLGFPKPDSWLSFGGQWSVYLALGTAFGLWLSNPFPLSQLAKLIPLLPVIALMASLNAFNEEFIYRSAVFSTLEEHIGQKHVWYLSAVFFGIAHFWGVPNGYIGVILASFMGWILAKAMLETRGFFWSWWIHFLQDFVIFIFLAIHMMIGT